MTNAKTKVFLSELARLVSISLNISRVWNVMIIILCGREENDDTGMLQLLILFGTHSKMPESRIKAL